MITRSGPRARPNAHRQARTPERAPMNPGDQVGDFELEDETGTPRRLSDLLANGRRRVRRRVEVRRPRGRGAGRGEEARHRLNYTHATSSSDSTSVEGSCGGRRAIPQPARRPRRRTDGTLRHPGQARGTRPGRPSMLSAFFFAWYASRSPGVLSSAQRSSRVRSSR